MFHFSLQLPAQRILDPSGKLLLETGALQLSAGEVLAVTGASGAGKSLWLKSLFGWAYSGQPATLKPRQGDLFLVQDPGRGLTPTLSIAAHVKDLDRLPGWQARALAQFAALGLELPQLLVRKPDSFSGGERQRLMLGLLLLRQPRILVCDEPAASLDESSEASLWRILRERQAATGMALVFVTHRLNLIESYANRVLLLEKGRDVFFASKQAFFGENLHPAQTQLAELYKATRKREAAATTIEQKTNQEKGSSRALFQIRGLQFARNGRDLFHKLSLEIEAHAWWWILGPSGSGKTSLLKVLAGLWSADAGELFFEGAKLENLCSEREPELRRKIGFVFQHGASSFNPARTVGQQLMESYLFHSREEAASRLQQELEALDLLELDLTRRPRAYSQGQLQRLSLIRSLGTQPKLLLCDEPTSSLDLLGKEWLLRRLDRYRNESGAAILFVTHETGLAQSRPSDQLLFRANDRPTLSRSPEAAGND